MSRLIDADELRNGLFHLEGETSITDRQLGYQAGWNDALMYAVDDAPTVDAVPLEDYKSMESTVNKLTQSLADAEKHGHWTYERLTNTNGGSYSVVWCSNCQARVPWVTKYCPNCGARMDEVKE